MSFHRHWEIFPSDKGATLLSYALAHRLDEFPAGYSSAGCSPAWPASASPAGYEYALQSSCRSRIFHRTANSVLTVCLSPGGHRSLRLICFVILHFSGTLIDPACEVEAPITVGSRD